MLYAAGVPLSVLEVVKEPKQVQNMVLALKQAPSRFATECIPTASPGDPTTEWSNLPAISIAQQGRNMYELAYLACKAKVLKICSTCTTNSGVDIVHVAIFFDHETPCKAHCTASNNWCYIYIRLYYDQQLTFINMKSHDLT